MCIPGLSLYYLLFLSVCFSSSLKPPGKSLYHISGVWGCELRDLAFNIFHVVPFMFSVLPVSTAGVSTHGKQRDTEGRTLTLRCDGERHKPQCTFGPSFRNHALSSPQYPTVYPDQPDWQESLGAVLESGY